MEHGRSAKKKNVSELSGASAALRSIFIGSGMGVALSVVLLFLATLVAYSCEDPDSMTGALGLAANFISAMAAGFCAVRINKGSALVCGAICGCLISCFFFLMSLFFDGSYSSGYPLLIMLGLRAATVLMSILGAYAGLHKGTKKLKRKRRK